jgi:shikimate dehydrogenase
VTLALADAGASSVTVVARRAVAAESCAQLAGAIGATGVPSAALDGLISASDLVVNTTPVGMSPGDGLPFDIDRAAFHSDQFVCDLIYSPATTPLLAAARVKGSGVANGLGMLIHQAGRQVEIWTGRPAPLEAMSAAVVGALGRISG